MSTTKLPTQFINEICDIDHTKDEHPLKNMYGGKFTTKQDAVKAAQNTCKSAAGGHSVTVRIYSGTMNKPHARFIAEFKSPEVIF